ncbi:hypothetical protein LOK49_Contig281G00002 [Camellia lanceoleosa]|nr:hypothetical protein LOK49_Contig281G00002 [Camellia lanceoleosa]
MKDNQGINQYPHNTLQNARLQVVPGRIKVDKRKASLKG